MSGRLWSPWTYLFVAAAIASAAFLLGQMVHGAGIIVAAGGGTVWTAYAVARHSKWRNHNG